MNGSCRATALATAVVVAGAAMLSGNAEAALRQISSQATNYCQSALPVFDGNIRKRPLGVQNEGTGSAFITCSYPTGEGRLIAGSNTTRVWQYFINNTDEDITVNCTGVSGLVAASAEYLPKSIVVPAGGASTQLSWFAVDFAGAPAVFPNQSVFSISCSIPPGAGLRQSYVDSDEDIGA